MRKRLATLGAAIALVLAVGTGTALAADPPGLPTTSPDSSLTQSQDSSQSQSATNSVDQDATSTAVSAPGVQSNTNAPASVGGTGNSTSVSQSHDSAATAGAENEN